MKDKIAVVGGLGNMGRRYCAILKHLGVDHYVIDLGDIHDPLDNTTGILIATPTNTHFSLIKDYSKFKLPILCEKPITKSKKELDAILGLGVNLRMINQYRQYNWDTKKCVLPPDKFMSHYIYYNSGKDGLYWDCINIIGLSYDEATLILNDKDPIWNCQINSNWIDKNYMDAAYLKEISLWLLEYSDNLPYIKHAHEKVMFMEKEYT